MLILKEEENVILSAVKKAQEQGKKIYILGAANGGVRLAEGLKYRGIDFDAFVVDTNYYKTETKVMNKEVLSIDSIDESKCIVLRTIADYPNLENLKERVSVIDEDVQSLSMAASEPYNLKYIKENYDKLNDFYEKLQDEKSMQVMTAYLNQKITGKFSEMAEVWDETQYFDGDFYDLNRVNCIVDCGAYVGDSFLSFCNEYKKCAGKEYTGLAYLLEPDTDNMKKIEENCRKSKADIKSLQLGAWDKTDVLSFSMDDNFGNAGKITDDGNICIKVDSIDHITKGSQVDFIKMDIEGAELNALKGAEETIKRDHPILAICAYHKRDDLFILPEYIYSLNNNYRFYLRAYGGPYSIELVLFAAEQ